MADTLAAWSPLYVPPSRTAFVFVRETRGRQFSAHHDGHMLASETTTPIRDSARMLLAEFGFAPTDRVVVRFTGATGDHEGLVSTVGKLAAKPD